ncbi:MAG TPA: ribosome biogenesis GTPase Der [Bryobacteraceae bacterium]|jgi:GTP-binding protein|nr:ribosome biogenesis GTPase Der [Bryobacteraceae bacterium]
MSEQQPPALIPAVVIVGRPNVGKSTFFNRVTGERRSIVGDEPGITRDRIHGSAQHDGKPFELIDTGGIVVSDADYIPAQILAQARVALDHAAHVIFLVDGRAEITASDRELATMLRKTGKPVTVVVNKCDTGKLEDQIHDFHSLGFRDIYPVSSEHGLGFDRLLDHVTESFPESDTTPPIDGIKVAIIGRPNVGKSTLLNALTGRERSIVSPIAGTTRDAVDETVERNGTKFIFVDTAGIRRKGKTKEMAEKLSVVMARRHIRLADIVLVVMDASEGFVALDATISGYAHEGGRPVILCINKWDLITSGKRKEFEQNVRDRLKFLDYAPMVFMSALNATGIKELFDKIERINKSAFQRVTTGELNRFVEALHFEERKVLYITQASVRPPSFILFTDKAGPLHFSHERYLTNQLRKRFGFEGTPIHVKVRGRTRKKDRPPLK